MTRLADRERQKKTIIHSIYEDTGIIEELTSEEMANVVGGNKVWLPMFPALPFPLPIQMPSLPTIPSR